ncbi:MAG: ribonuclease E/G, partial [Gammaproteobacteria bacterium]
MGMEILINVTPHETRVAVVENGVLQDVFIERVHKRGLVGNIYKGRVARVLPGMQAAFVEIGLDRAAFLHASDILPAAAKNGEEGKTRTPAEDIGTLLTEGQQILVQVVKDPLGTKGARLTMQIAIPSRYVVFVPYTQHIGVSHRLEDVAERQRLKDIVNAIVPQEGGGGYILRTAADGVREEELRADMEFLHKLWQS